MITSCESDDSIVFAALDLDSEQDYHCVQKRAGEKSEVVGNLADRQPLTRTLGMIGHKQAGRPNS